SSRNRSKTSRARRASGFVANRRKPPTTQRQPCAAPTCRTCIGSEPANGPDAPERRAGAVPIEAQSAAMSGDMARIRNDERGWHGVTSECGWFVHGFSEGVDTPLPRPARSQDLLEMDRILRGDHLGGPWP